MGPVKRTQALFDSPTETVATRDRGARWRVDYSILDESLHAELGVLDEIIKDGRKEREDTRQRHLRRSQKEKEMRARQGQGIREIKQPKQNSETFDSTPTSAVTKPDRSAHSPVAAPISGRAEEGGAGSECQDEQDQQDEQPEDMSPEILSPRQLLARVRLVRPPSVGPVADMPLDPAEIVQHIIDLSRRTEDQKDRERLSRLLAQLEPELPRLTPGQCASLLLALPQPLPHWTSKLLNRLMRQANALNTHTLVTLLLGLARLQKLADEDDAQVTAAIKEAILALTPVATAASRRDLQPLEAASLAIACGKATMPSSMKSLSTTLLPHLQAKDGSLLPRDVLACLTAFGATSVLEEDFLVAAGGALHDALQSGEVKGLDLQEALGHLPTAKVSQFLEVLNWKHEDDSRMAAFR